MFFLKEAQLDTRIAIKFEDIEDKMGKKNAEEFIKENMSGMLVLKQKDFLRSARYRKIYNN